jgi:mycothiol synthase
MASARTFRAQDLGALRDLINGAGSRTMTDGALREFLDYPWFAPETDLFVAPAVGKPGLDAARDVRVWARGDEAVPILESWGARDPSAQDDAPERAVFRAMLDRAGQIAAARGAGRGILQARCDTDDGHAIGLFESFGLRPARVLLSIVRPTLEHLNPAEFPPGIAVRPYRVGRDEEAWVRAFNEAFADHWGGFMGMSMPMWTRYVRRPWFKPDMSLVAWDGSEIAGFGHFVINDEQNALAGTKRSLMRYIGVRPRWRGIKLGVALTRAGLIESRARGMDACASGVDSENVTGAHHIYEREGFVTTRRHWLYRTDLPAAS